ncbi:MAG TPA: MFS transporter [Ignavibacteriaceae bacterium]|nr:MFS transporter [Ignavibacteriaceae bacterium]
MVFIDFSALNVALPAIQKDLNISSQSLLWIINIYVLFLSSLMLVAGSMGDLYGRKKVFIVGIFIFAIASLLCGLSPGIEMLIASRGLQGIGGALMIPGSLSIISSVIPSERRGKAFGTWSTFSALTTTAGPVLGGWLAGTGLWRLIFYINLPLAIFTILALFTKVPESRDDSAKKLDITGAILATFGLGGMTYGFLEASETSFGEIRVILSLTLGFIFLISFILTELKSDHPMLPLHLFKSRTFSGVNVLTLFMYTALNASLFFYPLNLVQVQGYSETSAGLATLPFAILISVMSRFSGVYADKFGVRKPLIVGPIISAFGLFLMTLPGLTGGPSEYWETFFPAILFLGIGMGIIVAPLTVAVMASVPSHNTGIASGINNTMARIAGLIAIALLGMVIILSFKNNLEEFADKQNIPPEIKTALIDSSNKLGETRPPAHLDIQQKEKISSDIKYSFVGAFNLIVLISVILSILSSVTAFFTVENGIVKE